MTGPLEHAGTATVWRPRTVPEQLALVGLACVPAAFLWPGVQAATGAQMLCPLRTLTGIPCPLCGMTRAATSLAAGDLGASLAYNPFLLVLAVATAVMAVLMAGRALGLLRPARELSGRARRLSSVAIVVLAAASWLVQLDHYGWI